MLEVTTDLLYQIIGVKEVELVRLRIEVNRLTEALENTIDVQPEVSVNTPEAK